MEYLGMNAKGDTVTVINDTSMSNTIEVNIMKGKVFLREFLIIPFYCPKGNFHMAEGRTMKRLKKDLKRKIKRYGYGKPIRKPKTVIKHSRFRIVRFVKRKFIKLPPRPSGKPGLGESIFPQYNPHAVKYDDPTFISDASIFPQYNPHAVKYDDPNYISDDEESLGCFFQIDKGKEEQDADEKEERPGETTYIAYIYHQPMATEAQRRFVIPFLDKNKRYREQYAPQMAKAIQAAKWLVREGRLGQKGRFVRTSKPSMRLERAYTFTVKHADIKK